MQNLTTRFRRAEPADAPALAAFAARTFAETFGSANSPADMAEHLASNYGAARQTRELSDPDYITLLAEDDRGLAAYAQLRRQDPPAGVTEDAPVELYRFYVDSAWQGTGLAQRLFTCVREAARELGGNRLWLSVWEHNPRAIFFYEKCGCRDVGVKDFFLGSDRQTDRVMVAELG